MDSSRQVADHPGAGWRSLIDPVTLSDDGGVPSVGSLVGGAALPAAKPSEPRVSPATGLPLWRGCDAGAEAVAPAVAAARAAFDDGPWGRATGRDRARVLFGAATLLQRRAEEMAALLVLETGKPLREARGEVAATVNALEFFAGLARDVGGRSTRDIDGGLLALTLREPAGTAGLVVPWNFPLAILGQKLAPALAAGCAVVIKPSPLTPLSSLALGALLVEAGLDPGALSVVVAEGAAGAELVAHEDVDVVSFTGSTATGRRIAASAGDRRLKRVALEAGGKTPVLVTERADLDRVLDGLTFAAFFNQGQVCVAGSRVLVAARLADEVAEGLAERAARIALGDPFAAGTEMGPLISRAHLAGVERAVGEAVADGARVLTGARAATPEGTPAGPFWSPTVLWCPDDANVAVREELFGPVTVVQPVADTEEAVRRANASRYGLAASVWTEDLTEALTLTRRLRTGTVWVNGGVDAHPELPLGGRRDSGYGAEFGREGMHFFTETKTAQIRLDRATPWYGGNA